MKTPKELLTSAYRKQLWKHVARMLKRIDKSIPLSQVHVMGSFTTRKRRPADVDFVVMLRTPQKKKWSLDLVVVPDNAHGKKVFEDTRAWMKQKYGTKKSAVIRLK